jgi:NitT/TauT family transport system permease protein
MVIHPDNLEALKNVDQGVPHVGKRLVWPGLLAFLLLLVSWELAALLSGWSTHIFPDPLTVALSLVDLITDGTLLKHTVASLFRVTTGFFLAVLLGIPLGIVLGRIRAAFAVVNPVIQFLRPISPLAWIPLAMLWFGIGDPPAIFLIFLASFFPLVVSTTIAVANINPTFFQVAANFDFRRSELITKLIMPAIMPEVVTALRLTITIAWLVVVAAEMIAVQSGLGYLILDSRNALRMDYVMDGMIVIGTIGLILDYLMKRLGRIESTRWGHKDR